MAHAKMVVCLNYFGSAVTFKIVGGREEGEGGVNKP